MLQTLHNEKKPVEEMRRHEIIFALASHVHQDMYHSILDWPTEGLRSLLLNQLEKEPQNSVRKLIYPIIIESHGSIR